MADRDFKGVWIPKEIWLNESLSMLEKGLLAEIDSLDKGEGCWSSNSSLAQFCQCTERKVSDAISKLISMGYVQVISFDGRHRKLRSCLEKSSRQTRKNFQADTKKVPPNNTNNNTSTKTSNYKKTVYSSEFESIWSIYPNGAAKKDAFNAWNKLKPDAELIEIIKNDIHRRVNGEWKKTETKYIPHLATYLHKERWEDEQTTTVKQELDYEYDPWEVVK